MTVKKRISGKNRLSALGYGVAGIVTASLVVQHADFEGSIAVAFVIGLFGIGGIYRCIAGYDEL